MSKPTADNINCPVCGKMTQQIVRDRGERTITNKAPAIFIPYCSGPCYEKRNG